MTYNYEFDKNGNQFSIDSEEKKKQTIKWLKDNSKVLIVAGAALAICALGCISEAIKAKEKKEERNYERNNLTYYDRSTGHYWDLRRKPSNSEWIEIERRKDERESMGSILDDLNLLK